MMTEQQTGQETFQALLTSLYEQIKSEDPLQKLRMKAWDRFLEMGLPSRKDDVYRYIRLRSLYANLYEPACSKDINRKAIETYILPECKHSCLVFVNGFFNRALSCLDAISKRVDASSLGEAMRTYGGLLNSQWTKSMKEEMDPFALINLALHSDGLFLYLPPKTICETPIQILNVVDVSNKPMLIMPRLQMFIGTQSEVSIVSTQAVLSSGKYYLNMVTDLAVEEESHVKCTQVACDEINGVWHFDALRSTLKRNSSLKTVAVTDGAETVRYDYRVSLIGENAEAFLNGVWMLSEKKEGHIHVWVDHQAPNCRSMQLYKGALNDFSRSSFEGKILVRQAAQKTEAFQLNSNLLLSERANADSKPNLEIFADDVKASHGATVGQLDQEQIFYMKTRGFSDASAKNLLVNGFCREVIDLIPITSLLNSMKKRSENYLLT